MVRTIRWICSDRGDSGLRVGQLHGLPCAIRHQFDDTVCAGADWRSAVGGQPRTMRRRGKPGSQSRLRVAFAPQQSIGDFHRGFDIRRQRQPAAAERNQHAADIRGAARYRHPGVVRSEQRDRRHNLEDSWSQQLALHTLNALSLKSDDRADNWEARSPSAHFPSRRARADDLLFGT